LKSFSQYKPVNSDHLIEAMEEIIAEKGLDFPNFRGAFRTWENQEGVPLVTAVYNTQNRSFILTQERFFETKKINSDDESSWYIPLNFATELNPNFEDTKVTDFLRDGQKDLRIPISNFDSSKWFIFNVRQIGYYRVNYDARNWQALTRILHANHSIIDVVNRMHLIDNAFVLAHGGYLDYKIPYDIITYLVNDASFFPWDIFMDNMNRLFDVFGSRHEILNVG
jgi:aminopeptidase N